MPVYKYGMSSSSLGKHGLLGVVFFASLLLGPPGKSQTQTPSKPDAEQPAADAPGPNADAKAYVEFGAANGMRGDLEGAVKAFETAISLDPKFASAYYDLGYAKSLQGKTDEALENYDKAIQLEPDYRDAYYQRGNLEGRHGDFTAAITDYSQVIRIAPTYAPAHYNLGHAYYFTGDLDKATKELDDALALNPNLPFAYFIRGLIEHANGHNTEATADFRKSLGLDFSYAAFWIYICESEDGLGDVARKDLTEALAMPEAFKTNDFPTAVGNFLLGNLPENELLAKVATAKPDTRDDVTCAAWFYVGVAQRLAHNMPEARNDFIKAVATKSAGSEEFVEAQRELAKMPGL